MKLEWSPIEGALLVTGSRAVAVDTAWKLVPAADRTPARRKLCIAIVDHVREYHAITGKCAP